MNIIACSCEYFIVLNFVSFMNVSSGEPGEFSNLDIRLSLRLNAEVATTASQKIITILQI